MPRNTFSATVRWGTTATSWATSAMPRSQRLARRAERDRLAAQRQLALVGREDAGDDLAERGLAGPVLADEGVDGAGPDLDGDVVERPGPAERLADLADLEVDVARAHGALRRLMDQPGHSASGRNVSTFSFVTTPPSGRLARTSTPGGGRARPDRLDELLGAQPALGRGCLHDGAVALARLDALERESPPP